ncbi:MAG: uroporphyrinogen decarboxylase family protein [bacterium]|nr:uroporphyrinogen decarboxylase family protein [bacterium]
MTSRERIKTIISGENPDRCGFWLGKPHDDSWPILYRYFGVNSQESIRRKLNDDFRWICPQFLPTAYRDPQGRNMFDAGLDKQLHGQLGPFADCEDPEDVETFPWPNPDYLNFDECLDMLRSTGDVYRASGFWTCFYHNVMDLFGMESYMVKMYTHPQVVHAVTDKVCEFYYEANERFFETAGNLVDGFFFGNDFGTQLDLICGPAQFDEFIMPWFRKFTDQGHRHGYQVILHSCGAIFKVIDRLIEARVDCLHPLQAKASAMDAETLAKNFKGKIAFLGGIDTQELLVHASPEQVKQEVRRVKELLGPNLIVSPSHEAILPNVPPKNVVAMAEAAIE